MPFTCAICNVEIVVGETMISDLNMNTAHESCVKKLLIEKAKEIILPSRVPPPPPAPPPSPPLPPPPPPATYPFYCQRCAAGIATTAARSCSRCYLDLCSNCEAAGCCGSRPALIGVKTYCSSCGKPCKSMCPACKAYVHSSYGMFNQNCGGQHEEKCARARELRSIPKQPPVLAPVKEPIYDTIALGVHSKKKVCRPVGKAKKKKARSRR